MQTEKEDVILSSRSSKVDDEVDKEQDMVEDYKRAAG